MQNRYIKATRSQVDEYLSFIWEVNWNNSKKGEASAYPSLESCPSDIKELITNQIIFLNNFLGMDIKNNEPIFRDFIIALRRLDVLNSFMLQINRATVFKKQKDIEDRLGKLLNKNLPHPIEECNELFSQYRKFKRLFNAAELPLHTQLDALSSAENVIEQLEDFTDDLVSDNVTFRDDPWFKEVVAKIASKKTEIATKRQELMQAVEEQTAVKETPVLPRGSSSPFLFQEEQPSNVRDSQSSSSKDDLASAASNVPPTKKA